MLGPDDQPENQSSETVQFEAPASSLPPPYQRQGNGLIRNIRWAKGDWRSVVIANFHARIASDIILDDGSEQTRRFVLEANIEGRSLIFELAANEFGHMGWVLPHLGPQAIIYPGQQQHVRTAIQFVSGAVPQQRIFSHLGWRNQGGRWIYLHAGGALGARESVDGCQVRLRAPMDLYHLRQPTAGDEQVAAIRASLGLLAAAPDRISFPLLAAVYRAALGGANFSLFVSGPSGAFKSSLAAVCQQHFGAAMDAGHLPANFASTGNALEGLAFAAKDALLVVDDFAPTGVRDDKLDRVAERLFRAAGNRQGRQRLGGGGRVGEPRPPRALVLATGESVPPGESIRARMLVVEVGPEDVIPQLLSESQRAGGQGLLAAAMGGFVTWVAEQYEELHIRSQVRVQEIRDSWRRGSRHARTPAALAELQSGWEIFLRFALEAGAITKGEQEELTKRAERALTELSLRQAAYQGAADPAFRFLASLKTALESGCAHVADRHGRAPDQAADWGWRGKPKGRGWGPLGACIGWIAGDDLYLEPAASYETALRAGNLAVSQQQLRQRLRERGLLASVDIGRNMLVVRRTLAGHPRQVLHLRADNFSR